MHVNNFLFMGMWEHIKIGGSTVAQHPRVLLVGEIPQSTHTNKKTVVYDSAKSRLQ
jgi:hypothetical protein